MQPKLNQIQQDVTQLEKAIDNYKPYSENEKELSLDSICQLLSLFNNRYTGNNYFNSKETTENEAQYLLDAIKRCYEKLNEEKFPKDDEAAFQRFIDLRDDLGHKTISLEDLIGHDWFRNDEIRLPKEVRIKNRKDEIDKLTNQLEQTHSKIAYLPPLVFGLAFIFYGLKGNILVVIIGLCSLLYSIYLGFKSSTAKVSHETLLENIGKLQKEIIEINQNR